MNREIYLTNIEKKIKELLDSNNIKYTFQHPIRGGLILDYAVGRLAIECDGSHWHKEGNKRDRIKDFILKKLGWRILRLKEDEILNNTEECIKKIQEAIKDGAIKS